MSSRQSNLVVCACIACNGYVQFEAPDAGLQVNCPHCGTAIRLYIPPDIVPPQPLPTPPQAEPQAPPGP